jgi:SulP family sulfate permease
MLHALVLVATVIVLAPLASKIPHAVLAGILVKVGWDIIDVNYLSRAHRGPRWDLALMALVLGLTVFVDLITAVAAGVVLAALAFVKRLADEQLKSFRTTGGHTSASPEEHELMKQADGHVLMFDFGGPLSFGAAADLGLQVRERAKDRGDAIILDFSRVPFLDVSAARAVETIVCDAREAGRTVYVTGLHDEVGDVLNALDAIHCLPEGTTFDTRIEALRAAVGKIRETRDLPKASVTGTTAAEGV